MSGRRLWVASELYYPEETSTGYFLTRIAEGLAADYDVNVISGLPTYSEIAVAVERREVRCGTTIHRLPGTRFGKDRLSLRLINLLTFSTLALVFALFRLRRGDIVLVVTNPPTLPLVLGIAGWIRGAKICLLVHDVYPDVLVATGMLGRTSFAYRLADKFSAWLIRRFDRVVVLGRDMESVIARKLGDRANRLVILPNWADVDTVNISDANDNPLRRELALDGKFVVQFSGNMGRTHDLASVLGCAEALRHREDIAFLLVGYGGRRDLVERETVRLALMNVHLLPRQPRDRLSIMLSCSDLTVIAFVADMFGVSVPSRMYNIMAAGVPIVAMADPRSELALVVTENSAGWVLPEGDVASFAALVERLADDPQRAEAKMRGLSGSQAAARSYTLPLVLAGYRKLLGELGS